MALIKKFQYGGPSPFLTELGNKTAERVKLLKREEEKAKRREFERDTELYKLGKLSHAYYSSRYFPGSEIVNGNPTGAGRTSGADPVGSFIVGGIAASPIFKVLGKGLSSMIRKFRPAGKVQKEITYMEPQPEVPPEYSPYVLRAKDFKENNIKKMFKDADDYAQSPERHALDMLLNKEAHDLGFLKEGEHLQFYEPINREPLVRIFNNTIPEAIDANGRYDSYYNLIDLTNGSAQGFTPFHERLHYWGIGNNPLTNQTKVGRLWYNIGKDGKSGKALISYDKVEPTIGLIKKSQRFRTLKLNEVLDPRRLKLLDKDNLEYIRSEELPVHGLTTGKQLGIKPFLEYPGDEVMPEIILKANNKNNWMTFVKKDTPSDFRNYWKLLTGSYLATLPFINKQ